MFGIFLILLEACLAPGQFGDQLREVCLQSSMLWRHRGFENLTEHSDEGLGCSHRHRKDGARVLALVCQRHIADADAELVWSGANQLNPIISKG